MATTTTAMTTHDRTDSHGGGWLKGVGATLVAVALVGCASNPSPDEVYDPIEPVNRSVYSFNETIDTYALAPTARAWTAITPAAFRRSVGNFFDNLSYPGVVLNNVLQGKGETATRDTIRFVINSTLGLAGFFDPATQMGLTRHDEDFGQTLGVWGADSGAFLMLPLFGPSNARDVTSYPVGWYTGALAYSSISTLTTGGLIAVNVINTRAQFDRAVEIRNEAALDPYSFTRSSYEQLRRSKIYDGNPPEDEDPYADFFEQRNSGDSDSTTPVPEDDSAELGE